MCIKSDFEEIILKLVAYGQRKKAFLLSSNFCPQSVVCPCLGLLTCEKKGKKSDVKEIFFNPSHAAIKISINATAAEFICKNIFPIPVQIKKIIKNKTGDIQQIYLYQNVCK